MPVDSSGNVESKIALIGLAPGLHGANKTGIPFTSDFSGEVIRKILDKLHLQDIFITNAVRCYPKNNKPTSVMINNCHKHTKREIKSLSNLKVIISLGTTSYYQILKLYNLNRKSHKFYHGKIINLVTIFIELRIYSLQRNKIQKISQNRKLTFIPSFFIE